MSQDITLPCPVRVTLGGGLEADGKRKPSRVIDLVRGLNRGVEDDVANHPYVLAHLRTVPKLPATNFFTGEQMRMLDNLGLSPQQKDLLSKIQMSPEQRAALLAPVTTAQLREAAESGNATRDAAAGKKVEGETEEERAAREQLEADERAAQEAAAKVAADKAKSGKK